MNVRWLVPNQAYVILFGNNIKTATLVDIDGKRFFQTIAELKDWLKPNGLTVKNKKVVQI